LGTLSRRKANLIPTALVTTEEEDVAFFFDRFGPRPGAKTLRACNGECYAPRAQLFVRKEVFGGLQSFMFDNRSADWQGYLNILWA